jgi:putative restriction endonuclease
MNEPGSAWRETQVMSRSSAMAIALQPSLDMLEPPPVPVRRFSVEEYHRMIEAGVFIEDDRFELLEGWIVPKTTHKPPHDVAIVLASDCLRSHLSPQWHIRTQAAITTSDSEPEPDLAIVRGAPRDYRYRHPGPQDLAFLVEVADSSLRSDRTLKARLYARAAIPLYWNINLIDTQVEVYTDPTEPGGNPSYRQRRDYLVGDVLPLVIASQEIAQIAVRDVLP